MKGTQQVSTEDGPERNKTFPGIPFGINLKCEQGDGGGGEAFHSDVETDKDI